MGFRSYIGIVQKNGNVEFAYCHNYGGLDENGGILFSYYGKNEIEELLKGGEISVLDFEISTTGGGDVHSRFYTLDSYNLLPLVSYCIQLYTYTIICAI